MPRTIVIVPYQPVWPDEFQAIGAELRRILGPLALRIDHIGSTSVPNLAAKDIIDIQVTAAKLEPPIEEALNPAGYQRRTHIHTDHKPPGASDNEQDWKKWFFNSAAEKRPVNLHVRVAGRANQRYPLLFRDYLRSHAAAAEAYALIKMALARQNPTDVDAYYDVKDPVCDIIMNSAEAWAHSVGWQLPPSEC